MGKKGVTAPARGSGGSAGVVWWFCDGVTAVLDASWFCSWFWWLCSWLWSTKKLAVVPSNEQESEQSRCTQPRSVSPRSAKRGPIPFVSCQRLWCRMSSCSLYFSIRQFLCSIFEVFLLVMRGTVTLIAPMIPHAMHQVLHTVRNSLRKQWHFSKDCQPSGCSGLRVLYEEPGSARLMESEGVEDVQVSSLSSAAEQRRLFAMHFVLRSSVDSSRWKRKTGTDRRKRKK